MIIDGLLTTNHYGADQTGTDAGQMVYHKGFMRKLSIKDEDNPVIIEFKGLLNKALSPVLLNPTKHISWICSKFRLVDIEVLMMRVIDNKSYDYIAPRIMNTTLNKMGVTVESVKNIEHRTLTGVNILLHRLINFQTPKELREEFRCECLG